MADIKRIEANLAKRILIVIQQAEFGYKLNVPILIFPEYF